MEGKQANQPTEQTKDITMDSIFTINLNEANQDLAILHSIDYPKGNKTIGIPNGNIKGELHRHLYQAYLALSGSEVSLEDFNAKTTIAVKTLNGTFERIYSPAVYRSGEGLVIKWGDELFPLVIHPKEGLQVANKEDATSPREAKEGWDVELSFEDLPAARGGVGATDLAIQMTFLTPDVPEAAVMNFRAHLVDFKTKANNLKTAIKTKRIPSVLDAFTPLPDGKGSNGFEGDTISMALLPGTGTYKVIAYREAGEYGRHILQVVPPEANETDRFTVPLEAPYQVWTNDTVSDALRVNPEVSKDKPGMLVVHSIAMGSNGKPRVKAQIIVAKPAVSKPTGAIDLSFLSSFQA